DLVFHDQGAYVRTHAATVPDLAATMLLGPYRVGAYNMIGRIRLTNKTPCGTYRAPGRFESTFVRERLMDAIAAQLGLDRVDVRRRNLIAATEMPYARHLDTLGIDYRQVRVIHGQTDRIAFGMGTFASRVTVMTGEAARRAAAKLRAKALAAAANLLQLPPEALDLVAGRVIRKGAQSGPSM